MKRCPVCQSTYADDSLRFCLQDGAALASTSAAAADEFKTLLLPEDAPTQRELPPTETLPHNDATAHERQPSPTVPQRPRLTSPVTAEAAASEPKKHSTATIVSLTIVATIALLGLGGLGAWWLLGERKDGTQQSCGNMNQARTIDNQNNAPSNSNARVVSNTNTSPSPSPSVRAKNVTAEEKEVRAALDGWLKSFRARDIDEYMSHYADQLDAYYLSHNVSREKVRADKERAFTKYSTIEVWLNNIQVEVDPSGRSAVATFNKSYRFTGAGVNPFEGSGLNRFTWEKFDGEWLITGEEDLSR